MSVPALYQPQQQAVLVSQVLQEMGHDGLLPLNPHFLIRMGDPYSVFKVGSAETNVCVRPLTLSSNLPPSCEPCADV